MQLDGLIKSIEHFAPLAFRNINVIYKSDIEKISYNSLIKEYKTIRWVKESDFRKDLLGSIDNSTYTCFMVDDILLYRKFDNSFENCFNQNTICFSLRLGLNCNYSHPADQSYSLKNYVINKNFVSWFWKEQEVDFAYPLSLDGHVFPTNFIYQLLITADFENPNTLEANLQARLSMIDGKEEMISYYESKLVSLPVNKVNTVFNNRHAVDVHHPIEDLNRKFELGWRLDFHRMNFTKVNGAHKEILMKFIKKEEQI